MWHVVQEDTENVSVWPLWMTPKH